MTRARFDDDVRRRLSQVRERMHDELDTPLRIPELARQACLSEQHFVRLFRARYGVPPQRYLGALRIAEAKVLLSRDVPVTEVCMAVGYSSLGTFSRRFAAETALSPRGFQRQMRVFGSVPQRLAALFVPTCFIERFAPGLNVRIGEVPEGGVR